LYLVTAEVLFDTHNTGRRIARFAHQGGTFYGVVMLQATQNASTMFTMATQIQMGANEYVQLQVIQYSGGNLGCAATMRMAKIG
jgi:hypothetical protein